MSWIDDEEEKYFTGESPPVNDYSKAKLQTQGPVPVYLNWDKSRQIGEAQAILDPTTGKIKVQIELNEAVNTDGIFDSFHEQSFSLSSAPSSVSLTTRAREGAVDASDVSNVRTLHRVSEVEKAMSRHPAGKKRVNPNG